MSTEWDAQIVGPKKHYIHTKQKETREKKTKKNIYGKHQTRLGNEEYDNSRRMQINTRPGEVEWFRI